MELCYNRVNWRELAFKLNLHNLIHLFKYYFAKMADQFSQTLDFNSHKIS